MKKLSIAIEGYPFTNAGHGGPVVFLRRLSNAIAEQNLATVKNVRFPFYDIALFKNIERSRYNKPYVLRLDGLFIDAKNTENNSREMNEPMFNSLQKAVGVIFISEYSKKIYETFYGAIKQPSTVIHNSVDVKLFNPRGNNYRERLGIPRDTKVIITAAHWRRHKRLKETITLFNKLRNVVSCPLKLIVLGGEPDYIVEDTDIIYGGEIAPDELASWYRTGDMYLHLAWIEPCGNTQIEAMACGLPVLCTNNGGIGETVRSANGGIVSQADEPYSFTMVDYYNPPEPNYEILIKDCTTILNNLSTYKRQIVIAPLDINHAAKKYVDFITQIAKQYPHSLQTTLNDIFAFGRIVGVKSWERINKQYKK